MEAEKLQREAMRIRKKTLGDEHPLYASDLNNLAQLFKRQVGLLVHTNLRQHREFYALQGKLGKAEPLTRECLRIMRKVHGNEHPLVAVSLNNLAGLLKAQVRSAGFCC